MAELSGLDGLLAQFKEQARETIRAEFRAETEVLRTENSLLHQKIGEKDLLYQDVIRQRDDLSQEVQLQKLEIKDLKGRLKSESSLRSGRVSDAQRRYGNFGKGIDQKAPPVKADRDLSDERELVEQSLENHHEPIARSVTFGGFEILERPGTKFYRDMFDGSTFNDEGAALRKASMSFKPSKVKVEILWPHKWELLGIEGATEEDKDEFDQDPADSLSPQPKGIKNPIISFELPKQPRLQREYEERVQARSSWLNKDASKGLQPDAQGPRLASLIPRKRHAEEIPFEDLSPEDFNTMLDRRRTICLRCWRTSELCDHRSQCGACKRADVTCEYSPCRYGLGCRLVRCPRIHPDQWEALDGDRVVSMQDINGRNKGIDADPRRNAKRRVKDSYRAKDEGVVRFQS